MVVGRSLDNAPRPIQSENQSSEGSAIHPQEITAGRSLTAQAPSVLGRNSNIWANLTEDPSEKHAWYVPRYTRTYPVDVHHDQYYKFVDGTPEERVTQVLIWCINRLVDGYESDRLKASYVPNAKDIIALKVLRSLERRLFTDGIGLNPQHLPEFPPPNLRNPGPNMQDRSNAAQLASLRKFRQCWGQTNWEKPKYRPLRVSYSKITEDQDSSWSKFRQNMTLLGVAINEAEDSSIYAENVIALVRELNVPTLNLTWLT